MTSTGIDETTPCIHVIANHQLVLICRRQCDVLETLCVSSVVFGLKAHCPKHHNGAKLLHHFWVMLQEVMFWQEPLTWKYILVSLSVL